MLRPELLCPAGNMERLLTCLTYGADAVYVGGKEFSLRAKTTGFSWEELKEAISIVHQKEKRIYFCLNIYPSQKDIGKIKEYLSVLTDLGIDALIVSDPGVIYLAKETVPHIPLHLSTQANTGNSYSIKFWKDIGIKRVNLARELSIKEISHIRKNIFPKEMELEVFVHGAMCMAISGRCYLSSYLNNRSANKGLCTHPCRFSYRVVGFVLEEEQRSGKILWEYIEEKDKFSYFFAPEDLCLIKYLKWFITKKIDGLKIEGRMKTSSYLGPVVDVYATALRDIIKKRFRVGLYLKELSQSSTREATTGFFLGKNKRKVFSPQKDSSPVVARIVKGETDRWKIEIKHRWSSTQEIEILLPGLRRVEVYPGQYSLEDQNGKSLKEVHSGMKCYLRCNLDIIKENYLIRRKGPQ